MDAVRLERSSTGTGQRPDCIHLLVWSEIQYIVTVDVVVIKVLGFRVTIIHWICVALVQGAGRLGFRHGGRSCWRTVLSHLSRTPT